MPILHWLTRDQDIQATKAVPYRLLEEVPSLSAGDPMSGNILIHGDNLEALKALLPFYAGRVKCIYIDPPYNTRSAFEHYDDNLEHTQWIAMIWPRLQILRDLLSEEGSSWVSLDDGEAHYFKVIGDEIFGRRNFIVDVSWQKRDGPPNDRKIGMVHEHILIWAKASDGLSKQTRAEVSFNLMERTEKANAQYAVFDEPDGPDPRGAFRKIDTTANGKGGRFVQSLYYPIRNPYTGEEVYPRQGTCWRHSKEAMQRLQDDRRLYWGVKGTARTPIDGEQGGISPNVDWKGGGGFRFFRLGSPVFDHEGHINSNIRFPVLAAHVWFSETNTPWGGSEKTPILGIHDGVAYALLYNGILGDKRSNGGNVLTRTTLGVVRDELKKRDKDFRGSLTVYGEQSRLTLPTLEKENIVFKQTPYDVKVQR